VSGIIYAHSLKIKEEGMDITSILQDWVHISKVKFKFCGLVLGNVKYLTLLQALLANSTL
jgi:hypothetical protein